MDQKNYYRKNCPDDVPFFSKPLWLDFICPDKWDVVLIMEKDFIKASMPFVVNNQNKPTKIFMPEHTKFLGPIITNIKEKKESRLTEEIKCIESLEAKLPVVETYRQAWSPGYLNSLPFLWRGYKVQIKYCYIIDRNQAIENAYYALSEDNRRLIRKAENDGVFILEKNNTEEFFAITNEVFEKQNLKNPYNKNFLIKLADFITINKCGKMFFAVNKNNDVSACALVIYDEQETYLFAGGVKHKERISGANSLLIWTLIQESINKGKNFNFLGSIIKSKESYIRSFGGQLHPYLDVIKDNRSIARLAKRISKLF
ncbi:MAG: hypothetical protein ACOCWG_01395 [bacterium]